jgi:hypothetical protein
MSDIPATESGKPGAKGGPGMMHNHAPGPTDEEFDRLAEQLLKFKPLAKFFRSQGVDYETPDAPMLVAHGLAQICLALAKLQPPKPTSNRWTRDHDMALQMKVMWLRYRERLSERKAIAKIAATWDFPYAQHKRPLESDPKTQRELALRKRWTNFQRREKLAREAAAKLGPAAIWALALGVPPGEIIRTSRIFHFTRSAA